MPKSLSLNTDMLTRMKHIELHVMEHGSDMDRAVTAGLLETEELSRDLACATCSEDVGVTVAAYFPFAVVLDENDKWLVCAACIEDVTDPTTSNESADVFLDAVNDDDIELF